MDCYLYYLLSHERNAVWIMSKITEVRPRRAGAKPNNFSVRRSLTWGLAGRIILFMTPDSLSQMLSDFLDGARAAVVV